MEESAFWKKYAQDETGRCAGALSRLIQFDTVSGDPDPEAYRAWRAKIAAGFAYLEELARGFGFAVRNFENRALVIELAGPAGAPVLGFPIHLDVVPAGEGWTRAPFGGEIADGAVWGRGTQDDKGPIIQAIWALAGARELAKQRGAAFKKTIRIMVFSEEELGQWDDIPYYFEKEAPPDFSIVPDATFPITVGEKGFVNAKVKFAWQPALPGALEISAGERANVVPAKARLKAGAELLAGFAKFEALAEGTENAPARPKIEKAGAGLDAEFYGIGAHGSLPEKGYNSAVDALRAAGRLPQVGGTPAASALKWLAGAGADLRGGILGIAARHEKVGATTVNLGILRVNSNGAEATLNIRTPLGLSCAEVEKRVRDSAEKLAVESGGALRAEVARERGSREPIYVEPEKFPEWIEPMRAAYTAATGRPTQLMTIGGTTFAKAFPNAVCFGPVDETEPGEQELAHERDEHVTLKALMRNVEIYGRAIAGIALQG